MVEILIHCQPDHDIFPHTLYRECGQSYNILLILSVSSHHQLIRRDNYRGVWHNYNIR